MKRQHIWVLTLIFMACLASATAQKSPTPDLKISKQFDTNLAALQKVDIAKAAEVKKVAADHTMDDVFGQGLKLLDAETERCSKEISNKKKEYFPSGSGKSVGLDRDFLKLISDMPEPIISLPLAKKTMKAKPGEDVFSRYIEKVKIFQEQLKEEIQKNVTVVGNNPVAVKANAQEATDRVEQNLRGNQMIQEMGGLDKLKSMSPEERAALAKKMVEKVKQNPSAYTTQEADPKKAFAKKMMTDPGYAERYKHMNPEQQKEEYQYFKTENGFIDNPATGRTGGNTAAETIAIDKRLTAILNHRQELGTIVGALQKRTDDYFAELQKKLDAELAARAEALPVVDHGEAGKGKDTHPLNIAYNMIVYPVKMQEAMANKNSWNAIKAALIVTIAEYDEFLAEYWGEDKATSRIMIQKNQIPPAILAGICNDVIRLTQLAKNFTNMSASAQRSYDEKVLSLYE